MQPLPPVKIGRHNDRLGAFITLASVVLVVTALKLAADVLIPIALTVLLTFLLSPMVVRLRRWRLPKAVAILLTVAVAFSVIGAVGWVVTTQTIGLLEKLPNYEDNIQRKVAALKSPHAPDALSRASEMIKKLSQELKAAPEENAAQPDAAPGAPPLPVEVKDSQPTSLEVAQNMLGPLVGPLGTAAIVIVFVIAMLFQREDLRDRFIKVVSAGKINLATQALEDAARRVTRYLFMQLVVNATYGIPVGIGLHLIGVPSALLWGVMATLLRFIPFLGPWIAASFPVALAIAVDPGWTMVTYTLALFIFMEVISNNVIEVWLYGASTGISNLALMVAAVFWTWLWGATGLFLSTPLTVCFMVLGKYVPGLKFLSVLLGSEPVMDAPTKFYQRMLSMDADGMLEVATRTIEERSIESFYCDVFVPALLMSEEDRHSGALAEVRQKFIVEASHELIDELDRRSDELGKEAGAPAPENDPIEIREEEPLGPPVLVAIPARDDADEIVAHMLQHLLRLRGLETEVVSASASYDETLSAVRRHPIKAVVISALPPAALTGARQLCRRVKEQAPQTPVVVGIWSRDARIEDLKVRLRRPSPNRVVVTLKDAVGALENLLDPKAGSPALTPALAKPAATAAPDSERATPIAPLGLSDVHPDELFDTVRRDLAQQFEVPVSLVTIVASDQTFWDTHLELSKEFAEAQKAMTWTQVIAADEFVAVEDLTKDKRFSSDPVLKERGIRFYAGVPLAAENGATVGCISLVDTKPRQLTEYQKNLLHHRAEELMETVQHQTRPVAQAKE